MKTHKKKKKKLRNSINLLLIEKRVHMTITKTKKDKQEQIDRIQKSKGYVENETK